MSTPPDDADPAAKSTHEVPAVRATAAKCARCGAPVQARTRPFCSQRCAEIDLGSWFLGSYRIATGEGPDPEGDSEPEKP